MWLDITNDQLSVGEMRILGVSASSMILIGDAESIQLASTFDTPMESLQIGPFVPLTGS